MNNYHRQRLAAEKAKQEKERLAAKKKEDLEDFNPAPPESDVPPAPVKEDDYSKEASEHDVRNAIGNTVENEFHESSGEGVGADPK